MPANILQRDGKLLVIWDYMRADQVKDALRKKQYALAYNSVDRTIWWRYTNNATEDEICGEITSYNPKKNVHERGLSVVEHPSEKMHGYEYIYPVTGECIGLGSDGNPVLMNTVPLDVPQTNPQEKWVEKSSQYLGRANPSLCPEWFTPEWIDSLQHEIDIFYSHQNDRQPTDEFLFLCFT